MKNSPPTVEDAQAPLQNPKSLSEAVKEPTSDKYSDAAAAYQFLPLFLITIHTLASEAGKGDSNALAALHKVAARATASLNGLPATMLKPMAAELEVWPFNLSWVRSWNAGQIDNKLNVLGLGAGVNSIFSWEAALKSGAPTNEVGLLLLCFVEYCRRYGAIKKGLVRMKPDRLRKEEELARRKVHIQTGKVANFLQVAWPLSLKQPSLQEESDLINQFSDRAVMLPPLPGSRKDELEWFKLAMDLVKKLTNGEWQDPRFGLLNMNRRSYRKNGAGVVNPGTARAGIREAILDGFDAVMPRVEPTGFMKL